MLDSSLDSSGPHAKKKQTPITTHPLDGKSYIYTMMHGPSTSSHVVAMIEQVPILDGRNRPFRGQLFRPGS